MANAAKSVYTVEDIHNNAATSAPLREGTGEQFFVFSKTQTPDRSPVKCIAKVSLDPGTFLRKHRHTEDGEVYHFISGSGEYYDNDGKTWPVSAGDTTVCLVGDEHGLRNTGSEPLVFLAVIN